MLSGPCHWYVTLVGHVWRDLHAQVWVGDLSLFLQTRFFCASAMRQTVHRAGVGVYSRLLTMHSKLLAVLLLLGGAAAQIPDIVIQLDGSNFEHDTQAATGQTTGHWFVLFNAQSSNRHKQASELWAELAQDEDKRVILAEVDLDAEQNVFLARRFSMVQPPSAVLFRDRKMYAYPASVTDSGAADKLREFCQGGYESVAAQDVPGSRRIPTTQEMEQTRSSQQKYGYIGLGLLAVGLLIRWFMQPAERRSGPAGSATGSQRQSNADPLAPSRAKKAT